MLDHNDQLQKDTLHESDEREMVSDLQFWLRNGLKSSCPKSGLLGFPKKYPVVHSWGDKQHMTCGT